MAYLLLFVGASVAIQLVLLRVSQEWRQLLWLVGPGAVVGMAANWLWFTPEVWPGWLGNAVRFAAFFIVTNLALHQHIIKPHLNKHRR